MENKKIIVVYYTRTGTTKKVAEAIADNLKCEIEEIIDTKNRKGIIGWLRSGADATKERLAVIKDIKHNPASYDIVIIGTPVWGSNLTPAIRTYITQNKENLKNVAFFCTADGDGKKALENLEKFIGRKPVFSFGVRSKEVKKGKYVQKVKEFFDKVKI
jgi:flavodoxin